MGMYYMQAERRAVFLANYAREHAKAIQERRDQFAYIRTGLHYSENEILSSIRAHADDDHLRATVKASKLTSQQLGCGSDPETLADGVDIEQTAKTFAERTDKMRDQDACRRARKKAAMFLGA